MFPITIDEHVHDKIANAIYTRYCECVGGKAFNGDPLPDWITFRTDPAKIKQSTAWIETAKTAFATVADILN